MTDLAGWYAADDLSPVAKAQALEQMADAREAAAERREAGVREAAREQRLESMLFANRQAGDPLGGIQRARAAYTDADDECRELAAQLERAQAKRGRAEANVAFFAERAQQANQLATRSASADLLSPAREALADAAAARVERMLAAASVSRPKELSRSRGDAVRRSEHCVHCINDGVDDETSYLLHLDPELDVPVTTPEQAEMMNLNLPQRSAHGGHRPMIYR